MWISVRVLPGVRIGGRIGSRRPRTPQRGPGCVQFAIVVFGIIGAIALCIPIAIGYGIFRLVRDRDRIRAALPTPRMPHPYALTAVGVIGAAVAASIALRQIAIAIAAVAIAAVMAVSRNLD